MLVSPVDEVDTDPCDAQPEDYDIAYAADRLEHYTDAPGHPHRPSLGRACAPSRADRTPTAGFAPDAPGFFWLAGQGGYGLQTAPAMAEIVEALIDRRRPGRFPASRPEQIRPERFLAA